MEMRTPIHSDDIEWVDIYQDCRQDPSIPHYVNTLFLPALRIRVCWVRRVLNILRKVGAIALDLAPPKQ